MDMTDSAMNTGHWFAIESIQCFHRRTHPEFMTEYTISQRAFIEDRLISPGNHETKKKILGNIGLYPCMPDILIYSVSDFVPMLSLKSLKS